MLVLSRKASEVVQVGDNIKVTVVKIDGNRVKIGIDAPDDIRILRGELNEWKAFSFGDPGCTPESIETELATC